MTRRTCSHPGCTTVLRRTNESDVCELHRPGDEPLSCMRYHGQTFGLCAACRVVKERRQFTKGSTVCRLCAAKAASAADVRTCARCGQTHPVTPQFWHFEGAKRVGTCKDCRNAQRRERHRKHAEKKVTR